MQDHRGRSLSFLRWLAIYCKLITEPLLGGYVGKRFLLSNRFVQRFRVRVRVRARLCRSSRTQISRLSSFDSSCSIYIDLGQGISINRCLFYPLDMVIFDYLQYEFSLSNSL